MQDLCSIGMFNLKCNMQMITMERKRLLKKYKADYEQYKKRALQNLEVKAEYDALQPE